MGEYRTSSGEIGRGVAELDANRRAERRYATAAQQSRDDAALARALSDADSEQPALATWRALDDAAAAAAAARLGAARPLLDASGRGARPLTARSSAARPPPRGAASERDPARGALRARLRAFGLAEEEVEGDGNCQFRALSAQLWNDGGRAHGEARGRVVAALARAPERYRPFVADEPWDAYLARMARDGAWGDHVTLQAAADALDARVHVLTSYDDAGYLQIVPHANPRAPRTLWLSFWAEVHYNSVREAC